MTRQRWARAIVAATVLSCVAACAEPAIEEAETESAVPVEVEAARVETLRALVTVSGTVAPAPDADWIITAPEAARIAELPKADGDTVAAGDLLVRFDIPALASSAASSRAAVAQARARLDLARASIERLSGLVAKGVAARREVEEARREQLDAEAGLTQAESAAAAANELASRATVRARFPGVVARRWHNPGDLVDASTGDPVLRVIDPTRLQVLAAVPVTDLMRIQPGRAARVFGPDGGDGESATVIARPAQVDTGSATADVRLAFTQPTHITSGTAVRVDITAETKTDALVVAADAVVRDGDETFVFVAGADGKAHRRGVDVGLTTPDLAEIRSGVSAGDRIITHGQAGLPDGAAITVGK